PAPRQKRTRLERVKLLFGLALVLRQAEEKLHALEPRALLPRRWGWPAFALLPLLALWGALLYLGFDRSHEARRAGAPVLAARLRDYARELQQKARDQNLRETLQLGRELEKTAQKNLDVKAGEDAVKQESAKTAEQFAAA